jgi:hypothetical protein
MHQFSPLVVRAAATSRSATSAQAGRNSGRRSGQSCLELPVRDAIPDLDQQPFTAFGSLRERIKDKPAALT